MGGYSISAWESLGGGQIVPRESAWPIVGYVFRVGQIISEKFVPGNQF